MAQERKAGDSGPPSGKMRAAIPAVQRRGEIQEAHVQLLGNADEDASVLVAACFGALSRIAPAKLCRTSNTRRRLDLDLHFRP